jgi:carbon monoxide dehydrogenase subunit G
MTTNVVESIDVAVPVSTAYNQWTQFADFSRFMKGVESVEQVSDTETHWRAKVFKSRRTWKAKIQEQIPDHRIVWTSEGGKGSTKGVVTFHPLADDLTRVLLTIEYYPSGVMEKTGNLWRAAGRRARLDLKNFRRFVMLEGEETGAWRGEVQEGKVTKGPDEGEQRRSRRREEQGGEERGGEERGGERRQRAQRRSGSQRGSDSGTQRPARKAAAKKAPAKKAPAKKAPAKKAAAKKAPAKKGAAAKKTSGTAGGQRAGRGRGSR